jgi:hypothetical protein
MVPYCWIISTGPGNGLLFFDLDSSFRELPFHAAILMSSSINDRLRKIPKTTQGAGDKSND